jgi:hypothetical protein
MQTIYSYMMYDQSMGTSLRLAGVWSAVAFFLLWVIGFMLFARWVPPISPALDAAQIAHMFASHTGLILAGMALMGFGAALYLPWTAVLADLIREIEGPRSHFLSATQVAAGVMSAITFFLPALIWAAAAFRPQRSPEITQALVDLGWLIFITPIGPFIVQYVVLAVAVFIDKRAQPAFPRWAAYLQLWVSVTFLPGLAAYFFKRGPLAWNGVFVWWIPLTAFTVWFVAMIALARRAVLLSEAGADAHSELAPAT